jgi:ATP-dependent 26S proteasome regulatory subunit
MNEVLSKKRPIIVIEELKDCGFSLRDVYDIATDTGPGLVVIEDIDTIAHNRDDEGSTMRVSFLQELLSVLDGESQVDGVITVATSNFKERVDRALAARPGRFDVVFDFDFPELDFKFKLLDNFVDQFKLPISAEELRGIEEVYEFLEEEFVSCAHVYALCAGVQGKYILDPKTDLKETAVAIAEQLRTVMQPDAGKHYSVRGFGG